MHVCIYGNQRVVGYKPNKEKITKGTLFRRESVPFVVHDFTERPRGNINLVPILRLSNLFNKA